MADETSKVEIPEAPDDGRVSVTIDGRALRVPRGTLVLDAATEAGVDGMLTLDLPPEEGAEVAAASPAPSLPRRRRSLAPHPERPRPLSPR